MVAINQFVEQNPEHRFPTNFTEVPSLFTFGTTDLKPACSRFVYLPPPPHVSKKELFGKVVLVEKLGHYKYSDGGNCGKAGEMGGGWLSTGDYKILAEKNGLSLQQLSEPQK